MEDQIEVTGLLHQLRAGNRLAEDQLINLVYADLRKIAHRYMAGERRNHTLQPTAIVHEAYARIFHSGSGHSASGHSSSTHRGSVDDGSGNGSSVDWRDRAHFFAVAASQMRRVLIDYGRAYRGPNRGGNFKVALDEAIVPNPQAPCDIEVIEDLLQRLQKTDPQAAKVVELKFFSGLTDQEVAEALSTSHSSVRRHWMFARAWMEKHLAA
ncbi:MAG TPA: ECF-type sigma factor [Candidatus Angelobacter sp.]|nr:ECF-type sigma factor [Candidatus Angelobacter sp.]